MIQALRPLPAAPSRPASVRRRPVRTFGVRAYAAPVALSEEMPASRWPVGRDDLAFFLSCYVAGLVFFLIMLT